MEFRVTATRGRRASDTNARGGPLSIGGLTYPDGIGVEAPSELVVTVPGGARRFMAWVGVDDADSSADVRCTVHADDALAFDSGRLRGRRREGHMNLDRPICASVPVRGVKAVHLVVEGAGLVDWAGARFVPDGERAWPWPVPRPAAAGALAPTPPMGLNTWNAFGVEINESLIVELADAMVATGLRDAGYTYLNLDDGWQGDPACDTAGNPLWHTERFPNGIRPLADAVRAKGLRFGIYTRPAWVGGCESKVAHAFAQWGVDYLKYDFSEVDGRDTNARMVEAVRVTGRPTLFNVCEWGLNRPWEWGAAIDAQTWRTSFDVVDKWTTEIDCNRGLGLLKAADQAEALGRFAGPGRWNDPDMLIIGIRGAGHLSGGCSDVEYRTQMGLWSLLAAPLLIGCDVRNLDGATRATLLNDEVIAIDQDALGVPGWRARKLGDIEVWMRPLGSGDVAVGLLNRGEAAAEITAAWCDLDVTGPQRVRDLWARADLGILEEAVTRDVASHEMVLLRLTPARR